MVSLLLLWAMSLPAQTSRLSASDVDALPVRSHGQRIAYGDEPQQFGELRLPVGTGPFPVAIIIHGGCWYSPYASLGNTAPLAEALTDAGIATWNIEYRRYDQPGGGWPGTLRDVAGAADFVRTLAGAYQLDTARIVVAGHSAGAQLALWLASRPAHRSLPDVSLPQPLALTGVVSIGGITDLNEFYERQLATCGNPAVESLLGGRPSEVPLRVREASPIERLPLGVPSVHIAGSDDFIAPRRVVEAFAAAARAAGDVADVHIVDGAGHFEAIAPTTVAGRSVVQAIVKLARPRAPLPAPRPAPRP